MKYLKECLLREQIIKGLRGILWKSFKISKMLLPLISQIIYKAESVQIYIKDIGKIEGIREQYISSNKCRIDENFRLNRDKFVSKFMEKYYAGNKSLIIDLENDSIYRIDNDEKSYYIYKLSNYPRILEEIKEKKNVFAKFSIKDLKDCNYEMKFFIENDSIVAKICYKDIEISPIESQFFSNYNKKMNLNVDFRLFERLGIFSLNNPFSKFLMSDVIKKQDLEKILKIKGYPYNVNIKYYNDTSLVYEYSSKLIKIENKGDINVFKIDSTYKRK